MAAKIRAGRGEQTVSTTPTGSQCRMWLLALVVVQNANAMSASGVRTSLAPNGVVQVELDRGGKLNALNRPMWEAIADAVGTSAMREPMLPLENCWGPLKPWFTMGWVEKPWLKLLPGWTLFIMFPWGDIILKECFECFAVLAGFG